MDDSEKYMQCVDEKMHERVPKRYIQDREQSGERESRNLFRYRFRKETVIDVLIPLALSRIGSACRRGLPNPTHL
ncbi:hypothetical protein D910_09015 [Dendroctonus ponderosae]|uniref:Uncharacterized protein n=1 Tax=Dendroctonus ponderosae TaxID=77166 RepID=U4UH46_DENPD|nr:hypothetical protein D910_09015 [Dendroctonus ponderosae]